MEPFAAELAEWLPPNDAVARPLVALATLGLDGYPDVRHVLLSEFDATGFFFHTDARSRKVAELAAAPRASFTIAWPELGRQLTVVGDTSEADDAELSRVYDGRSPYLQVLAHLNDASFAAQALDARLSGWATFTAAHPTGTLTPPATWTGIHLRPRRVTFWHGRPDTASQRTEYTREADGSWSLATLPG
ncbi:pyridoxine 5'-phosphate oxidase [Subtercola sp. Z020]|uniref:pyridoxine/pyridoxamine 5'-phosphate oxidase n=1 Tax=Subtercola sp. Z020 TaxID=2080582 RepID=UPI000CE85D71|nr:pyridoxamine 5'-phosphate oxidase family protein [Subtercola sp. Z020]PPF84515.1 pyridoxine 5'-phosphate oxidase [Subtercola sp. Z020]